MAYKFSKASLAARAKMHPLLQKIVDEAIKVIDFKILDATRGRAAQTKAFLQGNSKAKFGQSAHNYVPAVAGDLFPAPYMWPDDKNLTAEQRKIARQAFLNMGNVIGYYDPKTGKGKGLAKELKIPLRWGGDWNMDGNTSDGWDMPHFELHPWRDYAAKSKLYED